MVFLPSRGCSSFHVALNAPTTISAEGSALTYLEFGTVYSISILDTDPHPRHPHVFRYRTSIQVSPELWEQERTVLSTSGFAPEHPLTTINCLSATQSNRSLEADQQVDCDQESLNGFSVNWSSNSSTSGSYCIVHLCFPLPIGHMKNSRGESLFIGAKTERTSVGNTDALETQHERCLAQFKLFDMGIADQKHLDDVRAVQQNVQQLEGDLTKLSLNISHLYETKPCCTASDMTNPVSNVLNNAAADCSDLSWRVVRDRWQELEAVEEELGGLRALLASVRPVTKFDHCYDSGVAAWTLAAKESRRDGATTPSEAFQSSSSTHATTFPVEYADNLYSVSSHNSQRECTEGTEQLQGQFLEEATDALESCPSILHLSQSPTSPHIVSTQVNETYQEARGEIANSTNQVFSRPQCKQPKLNQL